MISRERFLEKYQITETDFDKTGLEWTELEAIYLSYEGKSLELLATGNFISDQLRQIPEVHSLRMRIKEPEHLIEKIIRKKGKEAERDINLDNYQSEITDLVGVRALHLFKEDWVQIHTSINAIWEQHEPPVAKIRKGDPEELFTANGCCIEEHTAGYRSVHYLVRSQPTKNLFIAEIQTRTIFEEGWSEIDHRLRYPYETDNAIISEYLAVFNRLAGNADEMGTFLRRLKFALDDRELAHKTELEKQERDKETMIADLESVKKKLKAESDERKKLQKTIDSLQDSRPASLPYEYPSPGIRIGGDLFGLQVCKKCGAAYSPVIGAVDNGSCLTCYGSDLRMFGLTTHTCKQCGLSYTPNLTTIDRGLCFTCDASGNVRIGSAMRSCKRCGQSYSSLVTGGLDGGLCFMCDATGGP
jgi:putative GTP pyrophosphokinase